MKPYAPGPVAEDDIASKWDDEFVRDHAPGLRKGRNKGVHAALRLAKRIDAGLRDEQTPPERRRQHRRAAA